MTEMLGAALRGRGSWKPFLVPLAQPQKTVDCTISSRSSFGVEEDDYDTTLCLFFSCCFTFLTRLNKAWAPNQSGDCKKVYLTSFAVKKMIYFIAQKSRKKRSQNSHRIKAPGIIIILTYSTKTARKQKQRVFGRKPMRVSKVLSEIQKLITLNFTRSSLGGGASLLLRNNTPPRGQ